MKQNVCISAALQMICSARTQTKCRGLSFFSDTNLRVVEQSDEKNTFSPKNDGVKSLPQLRNMKSKSCAHRAKHRFYRYICTSVSIVLSLKLLLNKSTILSH